ncbi:MAG: YqgE/AlgH family protein [Proteobacteria bacterium]|nr:YqgE/AlgH family protein [Pseudomonadota bacterium]
MNTKPTDNQHTKRRLPEQQRQMLVAMPSMLDPNFVHGVTLLCKHDKEGAVGITVNRPTDMVLLEVFKSLNIDCDIAEIAEQAVFDGGPVHPERGFVLHSPEKEWESSMSLGESIMVTTSRDVLAAIAAGDGPEKYLVALGYAGWTAGQLEYELRENAWLTVDMDTDIIFNQPTPSRWEKAVGKLGIDIDQLHRGVGRA